LIKFKADYVVNAQLDYDKVFKFVRNGGLRPTPLYSSDNSQTKPEVKVLIPRPELDLLGSTSDLVSSNAKDVADFPTVPTEEPRLVEPTPTENEKESEHDMGLEASEPEMIEVQRSLFGHPTSPDAQLEKSDVDSAARASVESFIHMHLRHSPRISPVVEATSNPFADTAQVAPAPGELNAAFVSDNSVDDGHVFPAGVEFVKSWRVRNCGNCAWPESTVIAFTGGDRLGVDEEKKKRYPVEYSIGRVEPGANIDVVVEDMKTPAAAGRYVSYWHLKHTSNGPVFGDRLWCE
jgi:hypothetical protein